ncbi:unnamed protein product, partial [Allacma fusca]
RGTFTTVYSLLLDGRENPWGDCARGNLNGNMVQEGGMENQGFWLLVLAGGSRSGGIGRLHGILVKAKDQGVLMESSERNKWRLKKAKSDQIPVG